MKIIIVKKKLFEFVFRKHLIFTIGIVWLLIAELGSYLIRTMNLQYDDGGLGTILILGDFIYAFPFWAMAEFLSEFTPREINKYLNPVVIVLFIFMVSDFVAYKIRYRKQERQ